MKRLYLDSVSCECDTLRPEKNRLSAQLIDAKQMLESTAHVAADSTMTVERKLVQLELNAV